MQKTLKSLLAMAGATALAIGLASPAAAVSYVYVGSWAVADGPLWTLETTKSLSGQQAAALLFGGVASDYAISTLGSNVNTINFSAFLDGYDDQSKLTAPAAHDFVGSVGPNYSAGAGNYSAFVFDHACGIFYCQPGGGESAINYAFRIDTGGGGVGVGGVPEPASWAMLIIGFGLVGATARRRNKPTVVLA
jgi:PEP-CTERM motif